MTAPEIELRDPRFQSDRYGYIDEIRAEHTHFRTPDGGHVFLNQDDVMEVFRCEQFRFAFADIDETKSPYLANAIRHELLNMHGDQHFRLSRLVKHALRDRMIEGMAEVIDGIVDDLIAEVKGKQVEFCTTFADPLPARVLGPMFGVPYEKTDGLNDWIKAGWRKLDALQSGVGIAEVEDANRNIHDFLRKLLADRRGAPGDDLFSELMQAEIDGDRMSEDELVYLSSELASAGVDTTRTQLPLILLALLEHPDEWAKLVADPKLALSAVDEGMRYAPLPWAIPHAATGDFEWCGVEFKEGDIAFTLVPAANRDPAVLNDPHRFNITRDRARHFAFGYGMHACPGSQLARMEMSAALRKLAEQAPNLRLVEHAWDDGQVYRMLKRLVLEVR